MKGQFLQAKRAIVTGASRGIGAEIARVLAGYGADVVVGYSSSKEKAEKIAEEIQVKNQVRAKAIMGKLEDIAALKSFMQSAIEFLGGVDILVNNAGVESVHYALELPVEKWDQVMNVNLRAPFYCAQEAGKIMRKQYEEDPTKESVIINISSIHDDVPRMGLVHYCSAKAGMKMMTRSLGLEFAEFGTRVVCLSPGAIETDMNRDEINRLLGRERFESWVPAKRIGNVHEVAETVAFLASPSASYITSTTLYIDGGYSQNIIKYDDRKL